MREWASLLFGIMVDSVRHVTLRVTMSRDYLYMDDFGEQSVEFSKLCDKYPSTLMSLECFINWSSGLIFLLKIIKDFQFNTDYFETFNSVLKEEGYRNR